MSTESGVSVSNGLGLQVGGRPKAELVFPETGILGDRPRNFGAKNPVQEKNANREDFFRAACPLTPSTTRESALAVRGNFSFLARVYSNP